MLGLAGLNRDLITIDTAIPDPGYYQLPGDPRRYRDWILRVRGTGHAEEMNLRDSIAQSCDVYFYELANRLGIDAIAESLDDFGIGSLTGVDLPSEKRGILPSTEWKRRVIGTSWYGGETLIVGIGQGYMLATPMQLAVATSALATRVPPSSPRLLQPWTAHPLNPSRYSMSQQRQRIGTRYLQVWLTPYRRSEGQPSACDRV